MALWDITEVVQRIINGLDSVLSPAGFNFEKESEGFVRTIEGGWQKLSLPIWNYRPAFEFSFTLDVRLEEAEVISNRFLDVDPRYFDETLTALVQLEFLDWPTDEFGESRHRVTSRRELTSTLKAIRPLVSERVVPFFDEYRDAESLNRGLNPEYAKNRPQPVENYTDFGGMMPSRAFSAIAVAYLASDPRLPELVQLYRESMSEHYSEDFLPGYERLAAFVLGEAGPTE